MTTATTFDRQGYIVIKKNHTKDAYLIAMESWFERMPLSETYDSYGKKVSASDAGDHLELHSEAAVNAANHVYSEEYADSHETDFEVLKRYEIGDIISAYDDAPIYDFVRAACKEGEDFELFRSMVLAYNYWNGHNWATVTIEVDEWEPSHIRINETEEAAILSEFIAMEDGYCFQKSGPASQTATGEKYQFTKSNWQGSWEVATVEEV